MERARNISKSMISYLKRAREQKEFLLKETTEFERGKRHLANMMGLESTEMTQTDIDKAIEYLFPSGLFDKRARPVMKSPELIYKAQKDAQFGIDGRPHHYLFYTSLPNFYEALSDIARCNKELNKYEDEQLAKGIVTPPADSQYVFSGREWLSHEDIRDKFLEKVQPHFYEYFIQSLEKLIEHPYSNRYASLFDSYSRELMGQSLNLVLPELKRDEETGQIYTEIFCRKKYQNIRVKTVLNGSGIFDIDGKDILFFEAPYMRRAIASPMILTGMLDKVDIFTQIISYPKRIGYGNIATAIRHSVSSSIAAYVDPDTRERMRLAGLLTLDCRVRERKKFNQEGARRKYTWKKR